MTWNKMFKTGIVPSNITEKEAQAIAYTAWGHCMAGFEMPDSEIFGKVMAELATRFKSVAEINKTT
jgi:hypothetical protein